jgi:hypothetical protein
MSYPSSAIAFIIWHLIELAGGWIAQLISTARTIFNTWYLAARPIRSFPNARLTQCPVRYAPSTTLENTVLSGSLGVLLIRLPWWLWQALSLISF